MFNIISELNCIECKYSKIIEECGFLKETELVNYSIPLMLENNCATTGLTKFLKEITVFKRETYALEFPTS